MQRKFITVVFENNTLILQAQNVALEFNQILENGWTQVHLQTENERHFLGAESFKYILTHLNDAFNENHQKYDGLIDSESVFWVLSLSEIHCSIYANNSTEAFRFYIQNKSGETKFVFDLSLEEKQIWKKQIGDKIN